MANIAEGFVRRSDKELVQFLFIAMSSAAEVQSHLYIALDQGYIDERKFQEQGYIDERKFQEVYNQAEKTGKMISAFIKYLRSSPTKPTRRTKRTKRTKQTRQPQ